MTDRNKNFKPSEINKTFTKIVRLNVDSQKGNTSPGEETRTADINQMSREDENRTPPQISQSTDNSPYPHMYDLSVLKSPTASQYKTIDVKIQSKFNLSFMTMFPTGHTVHKFLSKFKHQPNLTDQTVMGFYFQCHDVDILEIILQSVIYASQLEVCGTGIKKHVKILKEEIALREVKKQLYKELKNCKKLGMEKKELVRKVREAKKATKKLAKIRQKREKIKFSRTIQKEFLKNPWKTAKKYLEEKADKVTPDFNIDEAKK